MAFFSFSLLDESFNFYQKQLLPNQTYYSKEITLWKELNNKKKKIKLNFIKYEKRIKIRSLGKKLLICLPPKFGMGDAIEYCLGIKSLIESKKFTKIGIAFCSNYKIIFKNFFKFSNIYPVFISSKEIDEYDTVFHVTLEIEPLKFQKYNRSNILLEICNYFDVPITSFKFNKKLKTHSNYDKISIFPVSTSAIRSMPINVINEIKNFFIKKYKIEVFIDDSDYSNLLKNKFNKNEILFKKPINVKNLIKEISNINFGIFIDSGPLHVAKLFNKKGVFIETSVSRNILLSNSTNIKAVENKYKSKYCNGPCGLVDIFSINKNVGCYETNKVSFNTLKSLDNLASFQRWNKKEYNSHFISNSVGCVGNIDIENVINSIDIKLREYK